MAETMQWDKLICDKRLGLEHYHESKGGIRSDFQRDYDRLIFSSPFRRLQNKTQVFPLPGSIFVHNRLTHSLEVSCVGKSLAREVATRLRDRYAHEAWADKLLDMGEIVAAACLAHDLGNPPFGHSGEKTIATFFSEGKGQFLEALLTPEQWNDLTHFEGNANSFRWLVHQFKGRRRGGFAMTYSMLMSIVKYPFSSSKANSKGKFGYFTSEKDVFTRVADELGMIRIEDDRYCRHPLVYLVEAADDICYQVMDIEDAYKLKILSEEEIKRLFLGFVQEEKRGHVLEICRMVDDVNEQVAYLRSTVIGVMIQACADTFLAHEAEILAGTFEGSLIQRVPDGVRQAYEDCARTACQKIYCSKEVLDIELAGYRVITTLMELMMDAVRFPEKAYSQLLIQRMSAQYEVQSPSLYGKIQAVLDYISGMTDVYALDLYRKIIGNSLPAV